MRGILIQNWLLEFRRRNTLEICRCLIFGAEYSDKFVGYYRKLVVIGVSWPCSDISSIRTNMWKHFRIRVKNEKQFRLTSSFSPHSLALFSFRRAWRQQKSPKKHMLQVSVKMVLWVGIWVCCRWRQAGIDPWLASFGASSTLEAVSLPLFMSTAMFSFEFSSCLFG